MEYKIKIKTKDGTYEYEKEDLEDLDLIIMKHPNYEELKATKVENSGKKLVKKIGEKRNGK